MASNVDQFISNYRVDAEKASAATGIPSSLILAQAALESGWGSSGLAAKFLNFFGIKDHGQWSGGSVTLPTTEEYGGKKHTVNAEFRVYESAQQSFVDWGDFLKRNSRYENAGVFSGGSAYEVADALKRAGYATDSGYATKLKNMITMIETNPYYTGTKSPLPKTNSGSGGSFDVADKSEDDDLTIWDWLNPIKHIQSIGKAAKLPWTENGREYVTDRLDDPDRQGAGWQIAGDAWKISRDTIMGDPARTFREEGEKWIVIGAIFFITLLIGVLIFIMLKSGGEG